ncbi:MAG: signal peptidase I [Eubacteriales bacterium]|nr:signal peptidase I [Eubacteriales bacterium]
MPDQFVEHTEQEQLKKPQKNWQKELWEWFKIIVIALLLGLFLRYFVVQRNVVQGNSMYPNLQDRDRVFVELVTKHFAGFNHGDIVTIKTEQVPGYESYKAEGEEAPRLIKRVIGCPGDHIRIKDGFIYVNDIKLSESYIASDLVTEPFDSRYVDVTLAEDEYYVLGDNRNHSRDSRSFGPVHKSDIVGKLWFRVYPYENFGKVE